MHFVKIQYRQLLRRQKNRHIEHGFRFYIQKYILIRLEKNQHRALLDVKAVLFNLVKEGRVIVTTEFQLDLNPSSTCNKIWILPAQPL